MEKDQVSSLAAALEHSKPVGSTWPIGLVVDLRWLEEMAGRSLNADQLTRIAGALPHSSLLDVALREAAIRVVSEDEQMLRLTWRVSNKYEKELSYAAAMDLLNRARERRGWSPLGREHSQLSVAELLEKLQEAGPTFELYELEQLTDGDAEGREPLSLEEL